MNNFRKFYQEIGKAKFNGDNWSPELSNLSLNQFFTVGKVYPIYYFEGLFLAIGDNDKEYKVLPNGTWEKIS